MIEYIPLNDLFVKPWFIICNDEIVTPAVCNTVHIEQTTDYILKVYSLLYCMTFLVEVTLISLMEIS